jgi:hypothetical protein
MPYRPPKEGQFSGRRRPSWNREPDYWLRESQRLALVESIRKAADSFRETDDTCPGCDFPIWEARQGDLIHRGCHCATISLPPGHRLRDFDPEIWDETLALANALRAPGRRRGTNS